jgi:hypothetical protein
MSQVNESDPKLVLVEMIGHITVDRETGDIFLVCHICGKGIQGVEYGKLMEYATADREAECLADIGQRLVVSITHVIECKYRRVQRRNNL